jgi:hypothetical protein
VAVLFVVGVHARDAHDARVVGGLVRGRAAVGRVPVLDATREGRDEPRTRLRSSNGLPRAERGSTSETKSRPAKSSHERASPRAGGCGACGGSGCACECVRHVVRRGAVRAWMKPKIKVMLHVMPSFSSSRAAWMPSHVPASFTSTRERGTPAASYLRHHKQRCLVPPTCHPRATHAMPSQVRSLGVRPPPPYMAMMRRARRRDSAVSKEARMSTSVLT